jgi:hypothetical protein
LGRRDRTNAIVQLVRADPRADRRTNPNANPYLSANPYPSANPIRAATS